METDIVTLYRVDYDILQGKVVKYENENKELKVQIDKLASRKNQRVIIKETEKYLDENYEIFDEEVTYTFEEFKDIEDKVEEKLKISYDALQEQIDGLTGTIESQKQTADALVNKALKLEMEVSRLKHRNLWQRIWNK